MEIPLRPGQNEEARSTWKARIAIVGAGAVGGYYGGVLAQSGHDVSFLLRTDFDAVRKSGLTILTRGQSVHLSQIQAAKTPLEIGPCEVILIALKTTANAVLEHLLPPLMHPSTLLVTLQNGLGNEEFLADRWGAERVAGGLCFVCLNRTAPGVIEHFDHGSLSLGEFRRPPGNVLRELVAGFQNSGIEAQAVDNLITERWRKLVWNIPFNGLAIAAGGVTVADVLSSPQLQTEARALMTEVLTAAAALGHAIPESFADFQITRSASMGAYQPSSLIDWKLGRPVEVESIWGEPLRQGQRAGAVLPKLETLYLRLLEMTKKPVL